MDFDFTPEQDDFRESVRSFAQKELAPSYLARAQSHDFPWEQSRRMGELGYLGLLFSEELGGSGADCVTLGIAVEEIGRADFNLAHLAIFCNALSRLVGHLPQPIRQDVVPRMLAGEHVIALGLTEPGAGSDAFAITTRAEHVDGGYLLTGEKSSISCICDSCSMLVLAKTQSNGTPGFSGFLVDIAEPGIAKQVFPDHGFRPMGRGAVAFDRHFVSQDRLIGEEGEALKLTLGGFELSRALIGLTCVAVATQAIERAAEYAGQRKTFGAPIATKQGVAFPLVEHLTYLESIRWLCYRSLWLRDRGRPHAKEAAQCKWWGPLAAREALHACLLTYGNVAYSSEHPVGQQLIDVMAAEIGDGTAQIQKILIARELLGRELAPI